MIRVLILWCAALLAGCAQWSNLSLGGSADGETESDAAERVELRELLEREPADTLVSLTNSPWGRNVQVLLHETYAAASGRNCRRLTVEPEGRSYPALVCRHPKNAKDWAPVRLLQVGGRPVLSDDTLSPPAWSARR